ncbi:Gfo/Idh/MocA family oxidoreductase [Natrialbaceae archaeon GCM10025810]|uniref:Gfo/Idh/MocA family oxidoreductase n=1 Tax=Halovalidus salilacus TaxID=3075124 RepID=UPI003613F883
MTAEPPPTTNGAADSNARTNANETPLRTGVVGVGSMGENHARVYGELRGVELAGVFDLNDEVARDVAATYGTEARSFDDLLERCDAVTVAVPTAAHYDTVSACLEAGVHVLVEKPIAETVEEGRALAELADERDLVLQVGHIERFNPAVQTAIDLIDEQDLEVIAVDAERLGPPVDRTETAGVIPDLMIHDVDVIGALLEAEAESIAAKRTADGRYATAAIEYGDVIASLTASRTTQKKIRRLTVTAAECLIEVDYLSQEVLIHRDSYPEYVTADGQSRFRHESVVERPRVDNGEPLKHELGSFVESIRTGTAPEVSAEDGLEALGIVEAIGRIADGDSERREQEVRL